MKELFNALLIVQSTAPKIEKDTDNAFFKSKYATLQNVLSTLLPTIKANGLVIHNTIADNILTVHLTHCDTAQEISTKIPLLNTSDMQKLGASITYAQRYGLLSLLGLAPDIDDDGNSLQSNNQYDIIEHINKLLATCTDDKVIARVKAYNDLTKLDIKILEAMVQKLSEKQGE